MRKVLKNKPKQLIGRKEIVDFPELGLKGVLAKIDTGAYTSTLHCRDIAIKREGGKEVLCFTISEPSINVITKQNYCFTKFSERNIKNSFGEVEKRYLIKTKIKIAGRIIKSIISLTNRGRMKYPALIGRRILNNKFIVDVSLNN